MESLKESLDMNPEAMETTKRILAHIIRPLSRMDKVDVVNYLCEEFDTGHNPNEY